MAACSCGVAAAAAGADVAAWTGSARTAGAVVANASPSASAQAIESGFMLVLLMVGRRIATPSSWTFKTYSKYIYVQSMHGGAITAVVKSSAGRVSTRRIQISIRTTDAVCQAPPVPGQDLRLLETRHRVAQGSQPFHRIGDFQHVLALGIAQRQKLRQPEAYPTGIIVAFTRPIAP